MSSPVGCSLPLPATSCFVASPVSDFSASAGGFAGSAGGRGASAAKSETERRSRRISTRLDMKSIVAKAVVLLVIVLVGFVWYYDEPLRTTPGFFTDEASIAYNALTISRGGADEHGVTMPVYFRAFGEYKNPVYIYLLAGVFRATGPSILAARTCSIVLGFLA